VGNLHQLSAVPYEQAGATEERSSGAGGGVTESAPPRSTFVAIPDAQPTPQGLPRETRSNHRISAAFLSVAIPGAGHFLIHRPRKAVLLLLIFGLLLFLYWPMRLPLRLAGTVSLVLGMIALRVFATCDAAYHRNQNTKRPSVLWLMILLPLALFAAWEQNVLALRASGFQHFSIPSSSMEPTVRVGSHVMVDRWHYHSTAPQHGDLAVYINGEGIYLLKRVIALGGETIEVRKGQVSVNGKLLEEPYAVHSGYAAFEMNNFGPLKVPAGKIFVMGDNRDVSLDSRSAEVGPVDVKSLRGVVIYTLPFLHDKPMPD
jgi:signal peptidase I